MVSFEQIQHWQDLIKNDSIDKNKLFKIVKVLYGTRNKRVVVKGDKGDMKPKVTKSIYSFNDLTADLRAFVSNDNVVLCPHYIITSLEILEVFNE